MVITKLLRFPTIRSCAIVTKQKQRVALKDGKYIQRDSQLKNGGASVVTSVIKDDGLNYKVSMVNKCFVPFCSWYACI